VFFNLPDMIKAKNDPYVKTFTTVSAVRLLFRISLQRHIYCTSCPDRQHLSYDVYLEVRGKIIKTVLCCIVY